MAFSLSDKYFTVIPLISSNELYPCASSHSLVSLAILPKALGPSIIPCVHIWTAAAPAITISITSAPQVTPPTPNTGIFTAFASSYTTLSAIGFIAAPDIHPYPVELPINGFPVSISIERQGPTELIATKPSAPFSSRVFPTSPKFSTPGDTFINTGFLVSSLAALKVFSIGVRSLPT